jgi:hypothetical protein
MPTKFLDLGRQHPPFGEIFGRPRRLAWPVNAYRVTLPKVFNDSNRLNAFERVILKLIDVTGVADSRALANETCIPPDMVEGILLRLRDRAFIDEHGRIIDREPEQGRDEDERPPVFITALLFRELATGKILPFLHLVDDANPLRKHEDGKQIDQEIRVDEAHRKSDPAPREVISALRAMKKRAAAFGSSDRMPPIQQITIARTPEPYLLECPIAIQKCDVEFRIADPFGNGFSLILESAFERLLEENPKLSDWLHEWKKSLIRRRTSNAGDLEQQPQVVFDNDVSRQRYPDLVASLRPSKGERFRSISRIHASIEWALFHACSLRPFDVAVSTLRHTRQPEHPALLAKAAERMGLAVHERGFMPVKEGKLLDFQNGQANFHTVLAIALLQAQEDESHPLRRIANAQPDAITRMLAIKDKRDGQGHGKSGPRALDAELSDDPFMRGIVHALLPDIVFADTPVTTQADRDVRADSLLEARASVQSEFSFRLFNRLGTNLQNRLVHAERLSLSCAEDDNDARSFADDLYAAVQSAFETPLAGTIPPDASDAEFICMAGAKASGAGLGAALPPCLSTVKTAGIRGTLQGKGQTLGACIIAFLLVSDDDTLRSIADSQPSFIDDIASVIVARRHGNEWLRLPKTDIRKLRKAAYTAIKTLVEA